MQHEVHETHQEKENARSFSPCPLNRESNWWGSHGELSSIETSRWAIVTGNSRNPL
jgi:hypothetical protein